MSSLVQPLSVRESPLVAPENSGLADLAVMSRETLGDRVTGELRNLLISGRLAPGEKLSLRKVAEAVGVSMMPVREAISRLAADGALEVLPGRAVRVPILSLDQFHELTRIRLVVEGYAAEEAARHADAEDLARIARHEDAFREAASAEVLDPSVAIAANRDFHFAVYRASGMSSLVEMIERLWLKAGPILNLDLRGEPRRIRGGTAVHAHAAALTAIRNGDSAFAGDALRSDIRAAAKYIEETGRLRTA